MEHAHTIMPQNCVAKETFIQKTVYGQAAAEVLHLMLNSFCVALQIKFHPREEQTQDAVEPTYDPAIERCCPGYVVVTGLQCP